MISQYWTKAHGPHGHVAMGLRLAGGAAIVGAVIAGTMAALASPAQAVTFALTDWYGSAGYQDSGANFPVPFAHPFLTAGGAGVWTYPVGLIPGASPGPDGPSGAFVLGPDPAIGLGASYAAVYHQFFDAIGPAIAAEMGTSPLARPFGLQDFQVSVGDFGGDADLVILEAFDRDGNFVAQDYVYLAEDYTGFQRLAVSSPGAPGGNSIASIALFSLGADPNSFYIDDFAFRMIMQTSVEPGDISPVPLPAGLPLLAGALGGLGLLRRRRRARA